MPQSKKCAPCLALYPLSLIHIFRQAATPPSATTASTWCRRNRGAGKNPNRVPARETLSLIHISGLGEDLTAVIDVDAMSFM